MTKGYHLGKQKLLSAQAGRAAAFSILAAILLLGTAGNVLVRDAYAANTLTVNGVSLDGRTLNMWVTISSGGATVKTGFTPLTFAGTTGSTYVAQPHDYSGGKIFFDHWDNGSTVRARTILLNSDLAITAYYKAPPPPNRVPVATNDSAVTDQDQPLSISVLANDSDPDGDPLTITSVTTPAHGSVLVNGNDITYTPSPAYSGQDGFAYTISDGRGGTAGATVTVQVNSLNKAPVANGQNVEATEDGSLSIILTATDDNGDVLTYNLVSGPMHGTLAGNGNNLTYTPEPNFNGQDGFSFKANDGMEDSNAASVSIMVHAVNDAPVANSQSISNDEDVPVAVMLSANDIDGDALSYSVVGAPAHGAISGTAPDLLYTPDSNYGGPDSFTFMASDGMLDSNAATITITVNGVNDGPTAASSSVNVLEDTAQVVFLDATDPDGDPLTYTITQNPTHGTLSAGSGNEMTYTPAANYNGPDSFGFKANDGSAESNSSTISITVVPVNDQPLAINDSTLTNQNTAVNINVLGNDSDIDAGTVLQVVSVTPPAHGTAAINAGNTITYTPAAGFSGSDSFTYTISDGNGGQHSASVSVTVKAAPTTYLLTVNSADMYGKATGGLYTVIKAGSTTVKTGFTPLAYTGSAGATFSVTVSDYGSSIFDHWDNGSTVRARTVALNSDTTVTAHFRVPTVVINPTSGIGGAQIGVAGTYFSPNSSVTVTYDGQVMATRTTSSTGAFSASFAAPALGTGWHTVQAVDGKGWKASAKFEDTTPPPDHPLKATILPKTGVYVALYMYPTGSGAAEWQKVIDVKKAHPSVPIVATFNPNSGPGNAKDTNIASWVDKLKAAGVVAIGYTYDDYGARSLAALKADADKYKNWYNADGLFIDEFTNRAGFESHYRDLTTYVKSIGMKMTMGNPGTDVPKSYIGTVDVINITEGRDYMPISWLQYCVGCSPEQGWHYQNDKRHFSYMRYDISALDTAFETESAKWVGLLLITNGNDSNGRWFALPPYFETMVATLDR